MIFNRNSNSRLRLRLRRRVRRGARLLDRKLGHNWRRVIDLDSLELSSTYSCVLGQVYGNYWEGVKHLRLETTEQSEHYGFADGAGYAYDDLTELWRAEVARERVRV